MSDDHKTRMERDTMGEMAVPHHALYGAGTARAMINFPIAKRPLPARFLHAYARLKAACAAANLKLGRLDPKLAQSIIDAAGEVAQGKHDREFPVDVYQTGSGTSTNMNLNEVIAAIANRNLGLGARVKVKGGVHPNDHVNMSQSSNDTFPTAMHLAAVIEIRDRLLPALLGLVEACRDRAKTWDDVVKTARTHLMDATPIRVGQVFAGYAQQAESSRRRALRATDELRVNLAIGGTAVGTGLNAPRGFPEAVIDQLNEAFQLRFQSASDHVEAQSAKDGFVHAHGSLKTIAVSLSKIANDLRLLGSGPRTGLAELTLPAIQPGSSIMPGKVNPVICESVVQVSCRVLGNDATISTAGLGGVGSLFELNTAMPLMIDCFLESTQLLTNVTKVLVDRVITGLEVDRERCRDLLEQSLMTVTALAPVIGYDEAAKIAQDALDQGTTIRAICLERNILPAKQLDALLDPQRLTQPGN